MSPYRPRPIRFQLESSMRNCCSSAILRVGGPYEVIAPAPQVASSQHQGPLGTRSYHPSEL
eukprot:1616692-Pyramimonas_sp.AAC.1